MSHMDHKLVASTPLGWRCRLKILWPAGTGSRQASPYQYQYIYLSPTRITAVNLLRWVSISIYNLSERSNIFPGKTLIILFAKKWSLRQIAPSLKYGDDLARDRAIELQPVLSGNWVLPLKYEHFYTDLGQTLISQWRSYDSEILTGRSLVNTDRIPYGSFAALCQSIYVRHSGSLLGWQLPHINSHITDTVSAQH